MKRFGAEVIEVDESELDIEERVHGGYKQLFASTFTGLTAVLVMLPLGRRHRLIRLPAVDPIKPPEAWVQRGER
jgi:hypothetical protein